MTLLVRDLMTQDVVAVRPEDNLATLRDLMIDYNIRHMPVVDREKYVVGLVSHRDLLRHSLIERNDVPQSLERSVLEEVRVEEVMTTGVVTVDPDSDIREAAQILLENKYGCLPVVEGERLVGMLTESDFVKLMAGGE